MEKRRFEEILNGQIGYIRQDLDNIAHVSNNRKFCSQIHKFRNRTWNGGKVLEDWGWAFYTLKKLEDFSNVEHKFIEGLLRFQLKPEDYFSGESQKMYSISLKKAKEIHCPQRKNQETDRKIISTAYALAMNRPAVVISADEALLRSLEKVVSKLDNDLKYSLKGYNPRWNGGDLYDCSKAEEFSRGI